MKLGKSTILAALVAGNLGIWSSPSHAADTNTTTVPTPGTPPAGLREVRAPGRNFERSFEELNLTAEQKTKVEDLLQAQREKMRGLRTDTSLSSGDRRTKMQSLRADLEAKMKMILTPAQFDKWENLVTGRRPTGPVARPPGDTGNTNAPAAAPKN